MALTRLFAIELQGELEQTGLDRFRKLLDMEPRGRLTDLEDQEFGHRSLRDDHEGLMWLSLWRDGDTAWRVSLSFGGSMPPGELVDGVRGEVLAVAKQLDLAVVRIWPEPSRPVAIGPPIELPTTPAWSVRLVGDVSIDARETIQRILKLRREGYGASGVDDGWRYVRRDAESRVLLQMYEYFPDAVEIVLLYDGQRPDDQMVEGLALQAAAAAVKAGLTVAAAEPTPMPDPATWERLGGPAAGAAGLDEAWSRLGVTAETPYELKRGLLMAAIMSSAWADPARLLRNEAYEFLIGIPVEGTSAPGLYDRWL